jgi:hypothetical protein
MAWLAGHSTDGRFVPCSAMQRARACTQVCTPKSSRPTRASSAGLDDGEAGPAEAEIGAKLGAKLQTIKSTRMKLDIASMVGTA